ncbi:MAG: acetone carboxylase subunit gamma [Actinobacteria bacterium]|nr:acetone carboxylase subunit gamma [Actinomycetota bacterium]
MSENEQLTSKENIRRLVEGELPLDVIHEMIRMTTKDEDRFVKYLEVLQEKVDWDEEILARISDHLYVVSKGPGDRVVKCDCGHELGDYRVNWKMEALLYCRRTEEEIKEVFTVHGPDPEYVEVREFYCPGCQAQLAVEVVPPGYPFVFEVLPDIDAVHAANGRQLEDAAEDWFQDRTPERAAEWIEEVNA